MFLYLHRILHNNVSKSVGPDLTNSISLSQYESIFQQGLEIIGFDEHLRNGNYAQDGRIALTFDDGYSDFLLALPHIETLGVKVLLFVTTNFLGQVPPYEYLLGAIVQKLAKIKLVSSNEYCVISDCNTKNSLYKRLVKTTKNANPRDRDFFIKQLLQTNNLLIENLVTPDMLCWEEIKELDKHPLVEIGSHTVSHSLLPKLSLRQTWQEIVEAKRELEAQLNHPIKYFSYPYGGINYVSRSMAVLAGHDYMFGTNSVGNSRTCVPRIDVTNWLDRHEAH